MRDNQHSMHFENARPKLLGLAYRILGSLADAEDAVQDTYLKWEKINETNIDNAEAWLTTACTRRCLDIAKSAQRNRISYIGTWLPEPIHTPADDSPDKKLDLATSLTTAFLLMLERLTPKERAAYLLYEIFDEPYRTVANTLGLQENTCRQLVSRARNNINKSMVRSTPSLAAQEYFLDAFQVAITDGDTTTLESLLSNDIRLSADGGGKVPTIKETLYGKSSVLSFLENQLHQYWKNQRWEIVNINSSRGIIIKNEQSITATVSFSYDAKNRATDIFIMRNPEKINALNEAILH